MANVHSLQSLLFESNISLIVTEKAVSPFESFLTPSLKHRMRLPSDLILRKDRWKNRLKERKSTLGVRYGEENDNEEREHRRIGVRSSYNGLNHRVDINLSSNIETDSKSNDESNAYSYSDSKTEENEDEDKPDYEVYNFKDSGDGESWQLGNDSSTYANAFIGGYKKCPVDIIVPRELKNEKGEKRPVEVIGRSAYSYCGNPYWGDKTKTVLVTKQVRIIKYFGLGFMYNVESFRIEEGSVLQSIEGHALRYIGYYTGKNDAKKRGTLTLPSTLSSVGPDGIYACNLFNVIIYCGTHSLTEKCTLEYEVNELTKVKVLNQYPAETIFGRDALKDAESQAEVIEKCFGMSGNPIEKKCKNSPGNKVFSIIPLLYILLC